MCNKTVAFCILGGFSHVIFDDNNMAEKHLHGGHTVYSQTKKKHQNIHKLGQAYMILFYNIRSALSFDYFLILSCHKHFDFHCTIQSSNFGTKV